MTGYSSYLQTAAPTQPPAQAFAHAPAPVPAPAPAPVHGGFPQPGGANPYLTPDQLWMALGYYQQPTEVDIDADLLSNSNPVATFLSEQQGMLILAQLISTVIDHRLKEFFESYMIMLMEAEDGSGMFLKPKIEQVSEEGIRLKNISSASVQAELSGLSQHLHTTVVAPGQQVISTHKQAAGLAASQLGIEGLLGEAMGGDGNDGPGALARLANLGLHVGTGGLVPRLPTAPMQPTGYPPMTPPQ